MTKSDGPEPEEFAVVLGSYGGGSILSVAERNPSKGGVDLFSRNALAEEKTELYGSHWLPDGEARQLRDLLNEWYPPDSFLDPAPSVAEQSMSLHTTVEPRFEAWWKEHEKAIEPGNSSTLPNSIESRLYEVANEFAEHLNHARFEGIVAIRMGRKDFRNAAVRYLRRALAFLENWQKEDPGDNA